MTNRITKILDPKYYPFLEREIRCVEKGVRTFKFNGKEISQEFEKEALIPVVVRRISYKVILLSDSSESLIPEIECPCHKGHNDYCRDNFAEYDELMVHLDMQLQKGNLKDSELVEFKKNLRYVELFKFVLVDGTEYLQVVTEVRYKENQIDLVVLGLSNSTGKLLDPNTDLTNENCWASFNSDNRYYY